MKKEVTYRQLMKESQKLSAKTIDFIYKNLLEQKDGHHILGDESFYEAGIETGDMKVVELKIINNDIYYKRADWSDENDWIYIDGLQQLDLLYIASLYS